MPVLNGLEARLLQASPVTRNAVLMAHGELVDVGCRAHKAFAEVLAKPASADGSWPPSGSWLPAAKLLPI
jgi:hypothetical protein